MRSSLMQTTTASTIYVVSGGNQFTDGSPELSDHLFMNDGITFQFGHNFHSFYPQNKSCVSGADIDKMVMWTCSLEAGRCKNTE